MILPVLHWIVTLFGPLYLLFNGSPKYYDIIIAFYILVNVHWNFFNGECFITYVDKKLKDCEYKLGEQLEARDLYINGSRLPLTIAEFFVIVTLFVICIRLHYSLPIYFVYLLLSALVKIVPIAAPMAAFAGILLLLDNRYLIPGLLLIFFSSLVVKHYDQISCEKDNTIE
jgi:hypothetical protein